jgi:uncharacterized protein
MRISKGIGIGALALLAAVHGAAAQDAVIRPPSLIPPPAILEAPVTTVAPNANPVAAPAPQLLQDKSTAPAPLQMRAAPLAAPLAAGVGDTLLPQRPAPSQSPTIFKSESEAFMVGLRNYQAGDKPGAARALEYAATKGHPRALWKLGRMHADGDGVAHDDLKAFEYFSRIADAHADEAPDTPNASFIASAFVTLGTYFLEGIPGTYVRANPQRAREMFSYAASYFRDPAAQFYLGQLYLDGVAAEKSPRQAARWLNLSAEKGHTSAQALLGHMLIAGNGVPRQSARGLMWLTLARDAADPVKDAWIITMHDKAFAAASEADRQAAHAYLDRHLRK